MAAIQDTLLSPVASGTDANDTVYVPNATGWIQVIDKVVVIPSVTVAQNDTDYITVTVSAGGTVGSFNTKVTGGVALTAGTPLTVTITGTGADLRIASGGVATVAVVKSGTGPAYEFQTSLRVRAYKT